VESVKEYLDIREINGYVSYLLNFPLLSLIYKKPSLMAIGARKIGSGRKLLEGEAWLGR
jgi:hypothetical protein